MIELQELEQNYLHDSRYAKIAERKLRLKQLKEQNTSVI
jgi:hypothetical protein